MPHKAGSSRDADRSDLSRLKVLVVDDNVQMINIIKTILRGFNIKNVVEARDAADAFDRVRTEGIDLVIVDYLMDMLDGIDFVRLIRTGDDTPNPFMPVIMLSAYSERTRVEAARDSGVTEFCCKPVRAVDLYRKVVACVNNPRPFIQAEEYFGPCRRRRNDQNNKNERRKSEAAAE